MDAPHYPSPVPDIHAIPAHPDQSALPGSVPAAIALGSNLGDRRAHIWAAIDALAALPGTRLLAASDLIETDPVGPAPQGPYLNAAALIATTLPPRALLDHLLAIEHGRGRQRSAGQRWGPRTLDLDLLLYGDMVISEPGLIVPHPHLHTRDFVLLPLAQIAAGMVVPSLGATVGELARSCTHAPAPFRGTQP
jgi:2-amino-4-hydroxy-6-hydroxymethyldihydropteridine diphosphokinase